MSNDVRTLYLLMSITFLALLSTVFLPVSTYYKIALFSTISLPAVYSARYFSKTREEKDFKFFKKIDLTTEITRDLIAVSTAYIIGYMVFVATSAYFSTHGLILYTVAFLMALLIRYLIVVWVKTGERVVDVKNPLVIAIISLVFAITGFVVESLIFGLIE